MALLPPPKSTYDTLEQARKADNEHAGAQGYVLTIKRTKRVGNSKDGTTTGVSKWCLQGNRPKPVAAD